MTRARGRAAVVNAAHVVSGAALLLRSTATAAGVDGGTAAGGTVAVVRVLGARHLLQGLAGAAAPRWLPPSLGAAVDGVHAVSMVGLALVDRGHRAAAAANAAMAVAFAVAGRWAAAEPSRTRRRRWRAER